jgi:hypothetical protein
MKKHAHNRTRLILKKDVIRNLDVRSFLAPLLMDSESFFGQSGCPCCPST